MSTRSWFVGLGSDARGPFTDQDIRAQARDGRLTAKSLVRTDDMANPVPAGRIKGLFPAAAPVVAPEYPVPPPPPDLLVNVSADPLAASMGIAAGVPLFREEPRLGDSDPINRSRAPEHTFGSPAGAILETKPATTRRERATAPWEPKPAPPRELAVPLSLPRWIDLWPLTVMLLGLGWIGGSVAGADRAYLADDGWVVALLFLGSVPLSIIAFLAWLRPRRVPVGTAIGSAVFTGVIGVVMLLTLQWMAAFSAHGRIRFYGRAAIFIIILVAIGVAYSWTDSEHVGLRWLGFVFGVGLCEEIVKLLPLVYLLHQSIHRTLGLHSFIALGFASGLGFGVSEALYIYNPWSGMAGVDANIIRWFAVVPSHGIYSAACAAALWKLGDHVTGAETWWGKLGVTALAALSMAVVHGTYDTVCSLGTVVALLMDALSLLLLCWWVRRCSVDEVDPPGTSDEVASLVTPRRVGGFLAAGFAIALLILLPATDELTALKSRLTPEWAALLTGTIVEPQETDSAFAQQIQVRFVIDREREAIIALVTNRGSTIIDDLQLMPMASDSGETSIFIRAHVAPGETTEIDPATEWQFGRGERLILTWPEGPRSLSYLAPIPAD